MCNFYKKARAHEQYLATFESRNNLELNADLESGRKLW